MLSWIEKWRVLEAKATKETLHPVLQTIPEQYVADCIVLLPAGTSIVMKRCIWFRTVFSCVACLRRTSTWMAWPRVSNIVQSIRLHLLACHFPTVYPGSISFPDEWITCTQMSMWEKNDFSYQVAFFHCSKVKLHAIFTYIVAMDSGHLMHSDWPIHRYNIVWCLVGCDISSIAKVRRAHMD